MMCLLSVAPPAPVAPNDISGIALQRSALAEFRKGNSIIAAEGIATLASFLSIFPRGEAADQSLRTGFSPKHVPELAPWLFPGRRSRGQRPPPASYTSYSRAAGAARAGGSSLSSWGQEGGAVSFSFRQPGPRCFLGSGSAASAAPCSGFPLARGHSLGFGGHTVSGESQRLRGLLSPEVPAFLLPSP